MSATRLEPGESPRLPEGITAEFPVWPRSLSPEGVEVFLADAMGMDTLKQIRESHRQCMKSACTLLALTLSEYVEATARQGEDSLDANEALERLWTYTAALLDQRLARQAAKLGGRLLDGAQVPLFELKTKEPHPEG